MSDDTDADAIDPAAPTIFAAYDNVALADALGDIEEMIRTATARRAQGRAEMMRRHLSALDGARFTVTKDVKNEKRFDAKAVKAKMGAAWYAGFQKPNTRTTFTVTAKPAADLGVPA